MKCFSMCCTVVNVYDPIFPCPYITQNAHVRPFLIKIWFKVWVPFLRNKTTRTSFLRYGSSVRYLPIVIKCITCDNHSACVGVPARPKTAKYDIYSHIKLVLLRQDECERANPHIGLIPKLIFLRLFLEMVLRSQADNVTTRVKWMFSWRIKMRVKLLGLSTRAKHLLFDFTASYYYRASCEMLVVIKAIRAVFNRVS